MDKDMEKEKNMILMGKKYLKENIFMVSEKNFIIKNISIYYFLKENY